MTTGPRNAPHAGMCIVVRPHAPWEGVEMQPAQFGYVLRSLRRVAACMRVRVAVRVCASLQRSQ